MDSDGVSAEERFKAIRERLEAATPGPWEVASLADGENRPAVAEVIDGDHTIFPVQRLTAEVLAERIEADEQFIANAPTDIAFLLDALAQVEAERDALREALDDLASLLDRVYRGAMGLWKHGSMSCGAAGCLCGLNFTRREVAKALGLDASGASSDGNET